MDAANDRLTLSIPSDPRYLCVLRGFFGDLLSEIGFHSDDVMRITLAVHEACANVIEHGYQGDTSQRIDLAIYVALTDITIEVRDYGVKTDANAIQPRSLDDVRPGGLGTHFMRSIMDDVTYVPAPDIGMLVRMIKRRSVV